LTLEAALPFLCSGATRVEIPGTGIFPKSEPACIYVGGELEQPFAALRAAVERDEGIFLLTGESGSGKSALLAKLADELRVAGHKVVLTTPHNNAHLIAWLSGVHLAIGTLPPVLLIDEADQLTGEDLKKLALGMRVILAGSDDLARRVPDASRMVLSRLSKGDVESLVRRRLAGLDERMAERFPNETVLAIAEAADGLPRNAVQIAERASLIASMDNFPNATPDHVRRAARSLGLGKEAPPSADRQSGGMGWAAALAGGSVVLALALAGGLLLVPEYLPLIPDQAAREAPPEPQSSPGRDVAVLSPGAPSSQPAEIAPPVPTSPPSETRTAALPADAPRVAAPEERNRTPEPSPTALPSIETSTAAASPSDTPETATAALPAPTLPEPEDGSGAGTATAAEAVQVPAASSLPPIPQRRPDISDRPEPPRRRFVADAPIPARKPQPPVLASAAPAQQVFTGSSASPNPYCRPYRSRVDMTGMPAQVQGIACLDENGEWVLVQQERN
jgi:type II secretory pathway predicted ATPase ExeA